MFRAKRDTTQLFMRPQNCGSVKESHLYVTVQVDLAFHGYKLATLGRYVFGILPNVKDI